MKRLVGLIGCAGLLLLAPLASTASAQPPPPNQARVTFNGDCSVTFDWSPVTSSQHVGYAIIANYNGIPVGTFPIGNVVVFRTGPIPAGDYLIAIIAYDSAGRGTQGAPTSFIHSCGGAPPPGGVPGAPTWVNASAAGSTVALSWLNAPGANGTEIEGTIQATGQVVRFQVGGGVSTISFPGVPAGNFLVRLRNFNGSGFGPYSAVRLIVVGVTLGSGDLQVTMTWNTTADMDLHGVAPNNACEANWHNRTCGSMFLDFDDTNGFGPENIYVRAGQAVAGVYQFYITEYSGAPNTTVTVSVTLYPGTANAITTVFSRTIATANSSVGYNVFTVDILNRTITETTGTRPSGDAVGDAPAMKEASASGSQ